MRAVIKNIVVLLAVYMAVMLIIAVWLQRELRSSIDRLIQETAILVTDELVAVLHAPIADYLAHRSRLNHERLLKIISTTVEQSAAVLSIEVTDTTGHVIASEKAELIGNTISVPAHLFEQDSSPHLVNVSDKTSPIKKSLLWAVLSDEGKQLGYMRILIRHQDIAYLYENIYTSLLFSALLGLIAIISLGVLPQLHLRRVSAGLAALLESARRKGMSETSNARNELGTVMDAQGNQDYPLRVLSGQLEREPKEFGALANLVKVGVILIDREKKVRILNDAAKDLLAGENSASFAQRLDEIQENLNEAAQSLCGGRALTRSFAMTLHHGSSTKRLNLEFCPLADHRWEGCIVLVNDQDLWDALDRDLHAAARLRGLSILFLSATHDLKAPINAMSMNLELLKEMLAADEVGNGLRLQQRHYVEIISSELNRLNSLLNGLFEQTAPSNETTRSLHDLRRLMEELNALLTPQARSQKVTIQLHLPAAPVNVLGYATQLKQALLNILLNALEAMSNGGQIDISLSADEQYARLQIADTGPGIPSGIQRRIFEMHFTTKDTGTGIGLYVARSIIEKHGGRIDVESELGQGACFEIILPLAREADSG